MEFGLFGKGRWRTGFARLKVFSFSGRSPASEGLKLLTGKCVVVVLSQTKALQELSEEKCLVVATGGGAVCKDDNWYINFSATLYILHVQGSQVLQDKVQSSVADDHLMQ